MSEFLNQECKVLLQIIAKDLFGFNGEIDLSSVELGKLYKEAKDQTVIAMAFNSLPQSAANLDLQIYNKWQGTAISIMQQTLKNNLANVTLTKLLDDNGVEHSTIKGYTSACYYKNPTHRQMGDIDFLVRKEDVQKTTELLVANGYDRFEDDHDLHIGFKKNGIIYELHTAVTSVPEGKEYILDSLNDVMDKAGYVESSCGKIKVPTALHHGIIMLMHMQRHMIISSGIGIRHLADWAVFVNSFENDEWVKIFKNELKKIGLWKFARVISKSAEIFLKMPSKPWFRDADEKLATDLAKEIFTSGNFGRKNETNAQEQGFFKHDEQGKGKMARLFGGITRKVYGWAPFYEKYKILLPIGYIAYFVRIAFQMIFKNKKLNFFKIYKKGNEQYDTYTRLEFFKEEN